MGLHTGNASNTLPYENQYKGTDKSFVDEILDFEHYQDLVNYTKNFDYEKTEFLKDFLFVIYNDFFYKSGDITTIKIEENVELSFTLSQSCYLITMTYVDNRTGRVVEYVTPKEFVPVKVNKEADPALSTFVNTENHIILNKPIYHKFETKNKYNKRGDKYIDFDKTFEKFVDKFIVFANVIDKEHNEMTWLMMKKEKEKLDIEKCKTICERILYKK